MNDKSIKEAANELGSLIGAKPINWPKPIEATVDNGALERIRNQLAKTKSGTVANSNLMHDYCDEIARQIKAREEQ